MLKVEAATKILIYLIAVVTVVMVETSNLLFIIGLSLIVVTILFNHFKRVWQRFLIALPFLFTAGIIGFFHQEGLGFALQLLTKLIIIILLNGNILNQFTENDLVTGLKQLRVPRILTITIFFIFRYYKLFKAEVRRLILARKLRGGRLGSSWFNVREYKILGEVVGAGLITSLNRSDRIYQAMKLRGLAANDLVASSNKKNSDLVILSVIVIMAIIVILVDKGVILNEYLYR